MITLKKYYKLIAIDLSKQQVLQENEDLIQQINFIGRLEQPANVFKKRIFWLMVLLGQLMLLMLLD